MRACAGAACVPESYATQTQTADTMKSKTSENLIASESKAGSFFKKDGADQQKQKLLKKGKGRMLAAVTTEKARFRHFCSAVNATNEPLYFTAKLKAQLISNDEPLCRYLPVIFRRFHRDV